MRVGPRRKRPSLAARLKARCLGVAVALLLLCGASLPVGALVLAADPSAVGALQGDGVAEDDCGCPADDEDGDCPSGCDSCSCCPAATSPATSPADPTPIVAGIAAALHPLQPADLTEDGARRRLFRPPRPALA